MMSKAWSSIEKVPYFFSRWSVKFQGHTGQKSPNLTPIERFRTVTPWNSPMALNYCTKLEVAKKGVLLFLRSSIKFQGHTGQKIADFDPKWGFPDCNSSLISLMHLKWCTMLDEVRNRCPIDFQGHPSNFKVTWDKNRLYWPELGIYGL